MNVPPGKVLAEGSIWKLDDVDLTPGQFASKTNAHKVTNVSGDIWRLYFAPDATPTLKQLVEATGASGGQCVVGPDHKAVVTPTVREAP